MDPRASLRLMPPGTLVPAEWVLSQLDTERDGEADTPPAPSPTIDPAPTWRERLWTAPAETRVGAAEVCEAFSRPRSWLYRHTSAKPHPTIPCRKFDGELVFIVGELRAWARDREEVMASGPMESTAAERAGFRVIDGERRAG